MTKGYQFREVCTVQYGTTVQYSTYKSTVQHFPSDGVSTWRQGVHWDLGQSIHRAIRAQARNIVPPRLQQVNPVADTGFFFGGITR